jgi:hypothetical protein
MFVYSALGRYLTGNSGIGLYNGRPTIAFDYTHSSMEEVVFNRAKSGRLRLRDEDRKPTTVSRELTFEPYVQNLVERLRNGELFDFLAEEN